MKNILGNLNKEHPEDAIIQKYEEKVKHAPVRADIRSSARVESSMQGNVEENSLLDRDSTLLYAPEFVSPIKKKREQLYTSVLVGPLTHSLTCLLTHLLTYSLTHSFTYSLTYSLTHLLTHSLTHSLTGS